MSGQSGAVERMDLQAMADRSNLGQVNGLGALTKICREGAVELRGLSEAMQRMPTREDAMLPPWSPEIRERVRRDLRDHPRWLVDISGNGGWNGGAWIARQKIRSTVLSEERKARAANASHYCRKCRGLGTKRHHAMCKRRGRCHRMGLTPNREERDGLSMRAWKAHHKMSRRDKRAFNSMVQRDMKRKPCANCGLPIIMDHEAHQAGRCADTHLEAIIQSRVDSGAEPQSAELMRAALVGALGRTTPTYEPQMKGAEHFVERDEPPQLFIEKNIATKGIRVRLIADHSKQGEVVDVREGVVFVEVDGETHDYYAAEFTEVWERA